MPASVRVMLSMGNSPSPQGKRKFIQSSDASRSVGHDHQRIRQLHGRDAITRDGAKQFEIGMTPKKMPVVEDNAAVLHPGVAHDVPRHVEVADAIHGYEFQIAAQAVISGTPADRGESIR